jgi:hypothetical protein
LSLQKLTVRELPILRKSAKHCPSCMSCGIHNTDGVLLSLAHSNQLVHGRGAYFKSIDYFGAIICKRCHDIIDGRILIGLTKEEKHEMHQIAHDKTLIWWVESGYLVVEKPKWDCPLRNDQ